MGKEKLKEIKDILDDVNSHWTDIFNTLIRLAPNGEEIEDNSEIRNTQETIERLINQAKQLEVE